MRGTNAQIENAAETGIAQEENMIADNARRYGTVSRALHWAMAALMLWQLAGMVVKLVVGRTPVTGFWVSTHGSVGTLLLVLILVRIGWALAQRGRRPAHATDPVGVLARIGHFLLYALMLVVPALAVLRMLGSGRPMRLFGLTLDPALAGPAQWMTAPANALHGLLAWGLLALILGHVGMVIVHRFVWRDAILARMVGR
jgi:cytochrome b561